jgi:hypothetical protein
VAPGAVAGSHEPNGCSTHLSLYDPLFYPQYFFARVEDEVASFFAPVPRRWALGLQPLIDRWQAPIKQLAFRNALEGPMYGVYIERPHTAKIVSRLVTDARSLAPSAKARADHEMWQSRFDRFSKGSCAQSCVCPKGQLQCIALRNGEKRLVDVFKPDGIRKIGRQSGLVCSGTHSEVTGCQYDTLRRLGAPDPQAAIPENFSVQPLTDPPGARLFSVLLDAELIARSRRTSMEKTDRVRFLLEELHGEAVGFRQKWTLTIGSHTQALTLR